MKRKVLVFFMVVVVVMQSGGTFVFGRALLESLYNDVDPTNEVGDVICIDESLVGDFEENHSDSNKPLITLDEPLVNDISEHQNVFVDIIESNNDDKIEVDESGEFDDTPELIDSDKSECIENENLINTDIILPEDIINIAYPDENEEAVFGEETKEIIENNPVIFKRENILEDDFFGNIIVEIESDSGEFNSISSDCVASFTNGSEIMSIDESVYETAPVIVPSTSLRASFSEETPNGMRFKAAVTPDQKYAALEYGFLMASTKALEDNNVELTFDATEVSFVSGVGYSVSEGIDKVYAMDENGSYIFAGVLLNIPETAYAKNVTARPYIIYNIDGVETIVYGDTYSNSIYRTSKNELTISTDEAVLEYAQSIVDTVENDIAYLNLAAEVSLDELIDRSICENPDIDVVKFVPEVSRFYSLAFTSDEVAIYEVLDEFGCELPVIESNNITNETAYLFEEGQTYYIRVKGEPNTSYTIQATPCFDNAIIYDFSSGTDGFSFHNGATGVSEDGVLNISIDKAARLLNSYIKNSNISVDLLDYSRLIIRMKNDTETTKLSGTVGIDLEYDGTSFDYSIDSVMSTNMTTFENVEFNFTTRYGNVSSLRLSFGEFGRALSGNIYIDSIAIIPMPDVMTWEFDETTEGWGFTDRIDSAEIDDGVLILDSQGSTPTLAPAIISPGTSAYDFNKYNVIKICLKNETDSDNLQVYFSTLANNHSLFNENKKIIVDIEPNTSEFIEYTIDLTEHVFFKDSLKDIMISFSAEGVMSIDYIELHKKVVIYEDLVWEFEEDLEGFTSNNERHTLSVDNGTMVVETQTAAWGAFLTPDQLDIPTTEYRYLVVGVNSATETSDLEAYFKTSSMYSYTENDHGNKIIYKHILQIKKSPFFREYVIDLSSVPDGYTSGYTGDLEQFMLALTTAGTYEIDYIKLTNEYVKNEDGVANVYEFNVTQNAEYNVVITKNGNDAINSYTLIYDENILELVDACAFSYPLETESGSIPGTDITIVSILNGVVVFSNSNNTSAGIINCLKFKALEEATLNIYITTTIE